MQRDMRDLTTVEVTEAKLNKILEMRVEFEKLVEYIETNLPESRARSLALTWIETSLMWASAAIARE